MSKWEEISLGELIKVKHGFAFKGEFFCDHETKALLVTPGNFSLTGNFQNVKKKYYNGPIPEDYILKPGQLVVTMTDLSKQTDTLGFGALIPEDENIWLHNQRVGLVVPKKEDKFDTRFLSYLLKSREYRGWIVNYSTGTTVKHTSPSKIESFICNLPPLPEQKSIAHILGTLDDKIELNRKMNETLEQMAQALFKSWFVDFDPVLDNAIALGNSIPDALKNKAEQRKEVISSGNYKTLPKEIKELFPSSFVFNEELDKWIPEGWEVSTVGQEFNVTMGQSPPGSSYNEEGLGMPFFQGKTDFGFRFPTNRIYCTEPKRTANKNDTLISVRAPVGNANLALSDCSIGRGLAALRHKSKSISFTYYSILQLKEVFDVFEGEGTVFGSINQTDLKNISVIKFDPQILEQYEIIAKSYDQKIEINEQQIESLTKQRDVLLPQLISGKLKVREEMIERVVTKRSI